MECALSSKGTIYPKQFYFSHRTVSLKWLSIPDVLWITKSIIAIQFLHVRNIVIYGITSTATEQLRKDATRQNHPVEITSSFEYGQIIQYQPHHHKSAEGNSP
jgi:hypothetical protein